MFSTGAYKARDNLSDPVSSSDAAGFGFLHLIVREGDASSFLTNQRT